MFGSPSLVTLHPAPLSSVRGPARSRGAQGGRVRSAAGPNRGRCFGTRAQCKPVLCISSCPVSAQSSGSIRTRAFEWGRWVQKCLLPRCWTWPGCDGPAPWARTASDSQLVIKKKHCSLPAPATGGSRDRHPLFFGVLYAYIYKYMNMDILCECVWKFFFFFNTMNRMPGSILCSAPFLSSSLTFSWFAWCMLHYYWLLRKHGRSLQI